MPAPVFAFDAETTHRKLTEKAIELKKQEHAGDEAFQDFIKQAEEKIIDGSEEEDYPECFQGRSTGGKHPEQ
jgi:hypothetical protein